MKNFKLMTLTGTLAIALALLPSISTAGNHDRGYLRGKKVQKLLSKSAFKHSRRQNNNHGYSDRSHNNHNNHNNHYDRDNHYDHHDHHSDHYDHHDHHYDRHHDNHGHHRHRDHFGHWFYSMNHNARHGFGFQFGIHK